MTIRMGQFKSRFGILNRDIYGKWWVSKVDNNSGTYLHKDGKWHYSTRNNLTGAYNGYFDTKEEAIATLNKAGYTEYEEVEG